MQVSSEFDTKQTFFDSLLADKTANYSFSAHLYLNSIS